jgi:hypothetical protein
MTWHKQQQKKLDEKLASWARAVELLSGDTIRIVAPLVVIQVLSKLRWNYSLHPLRQ